MDIFKHILEACLCFATVFVVMSVLFFLIRLFSSAVKTFENKAEK